MTVTINQLTAAYELGKYQGEEDYTIGGFEEALDDPYESFAEDDYEARKDVIFRVTGEKMEPDTEDGWLIQDNFENGYYDYWEDVNNGTVEQAA